MLNEITIVLVGLGAGLVGSIVGLGGGIIIVPILTYFGMPPSTAAANSLFATLGNAASSTLVYSRQHRVHYGAFAKLAVAAVPGTVLGALASSHVASPTFKLLFAVLLVSCIIYMAIGRRMLNAEHSMGAAVLVIGVGSSFGAGVMSSFFGIGGGVIFVPLLVMLLGYTLRDSTATSQAILIPVSLAAVLSHAALGHPDYYNALFLMGGAVVGGMCGAQLSVRIKDTYLRAFASVVMALAALQLVLDSAEL